MEIGLGILRLEPQTFWNMSIYEFYSALEGFKEFNTDQSKRPMTRKEFQNLKERYPD